MQPAFSKFAFGVSSASPHTTPDGSTSGKLATKNGGTRKKKVPSKPSQQQNASVSTPTVTPTLMPTAIHDAQPVSNEETQLREARKNRFKQRHKQDEFSLPASAPVPSPLPASAPSLPVSTLPSSTNANITRGGVIGVCEDMCPLSERDERERFFDVDVLERVDPNNSGLADVRYTVKKFKRTLDDSDRVPDKVRTRQALQRTVDYLWSIMDSHGHSNFGSVQKFLWDRLRSVRQDLTLQGIRDGFAVHLHEQMVRFHILAEHDLCEECATITNPEGFNSHLNVEQMNKCLVTLFQIYDREAISNQGDNNGSECEILKHEGEFRAYFLLLQLDRHGSYKRDGEPAALGLMNLRKNVVASKEMRFALKVFEVYRSGNWVKYFSLLKHAPYLAACVMHIFFRRMQTRALRLMNEFGSKGGSIKLHEICHSLQMSLDETVALCKHHGLTVDDKNLALMVKLSNFIDQEDDLPSRRSKSVMQKLKTNRATCVRSGWGEIGVKESSETWTLGSHARVQDGRRHFEKGPLKTGFTESNKQMEGSFSFADASKVQSQNYTTSSLFENREAGEVDMTETLTFPNNKTSINYSTKQKEGNGVPSSLTRSGISFGQNKNRSTPFKQLSDPNLVGVDVPLNHEDNISGTGSFQEMAGNRKRRNDDLSYDPIHNAKTTRFSFQEDTDSRRDQTVIGGSLVGGTTAIPSTQINAALNISAGLPSKAISESVDLLQIPSSKESTNDFSFKQDKIPLSFQFHPGQEKPTIKEALSHDSIVKMDLQIGHEIVKHDAMHETPVMSHEQMASLPEVLDSLHDGKSGVEIEEEAISSSDDSVDDIESERHRRIIFFRIWQRNYLKAVMKRKIIEKETSAALKFTKTLPILSKTGEGSDIKRSTFQKRMLPSLAAGLLLSCISFEKETENEVLMQPINVCTLIGSILLERQHTAPLCFKLLLLEANSRFSDDVNSGNLCGWLKEKLAFNNRSDSLVTYKSSMNTNVRGFAENESFSIFDSEDEMITIIRDVSRGTTTRHDTGNGNKSNAADTAGANAIMVTLEGASGPSELRRCLDSFLKTIQAYSHLPLAIIWDPHQSNRSSVNSNERAIVDFVSISCSDPGAAEVAERFRIKDIIGQQISSWTLYMMRYESDIKRNNDGLERDILLNQWLYAAESLLKEAIKKLARNSPFPPQIRRQYLRDVLYEEMLKCRQDDAMLLPANFAGLRDIRLFNDAIDQSVVRLKEAYDVPKYAWPAFETKSDSIQPDWNFQETLDAKIDSLVALKLPSFENLGKDAAREFAILCESSYALTIAENGGSLETIVRTVMNERLGRCDESAYFVIEQRPNIEGFVSETAVNTLPRLLPSKSSENGNRGVSRILRLMN